MSAAESVRWLSMWRPAARHGRGASCAGQQACLAAQDQLDATGKLCRDTDLKWSATAQISATPERMAPLSIPWAVCTMPFCLQNGVLADLNHQVEVSKNFS